MPCLSACFPTLCAVIGQAPFIVPQAGRFPGNPKRFGYNERTMSAPVTERDQTISTPDAAATPTRLRRWTRAEYYRMAEAGLLGPDEKTELLDGEIWNKVRPVGTRHMAAVRASAEALADAFGPGFEIHYQTPITLSDFSEPAPDVAVVPGTWRDYLDHHPGPSEVRLLVEISDSTLREDRGRKARLYALEGIADYWIVNLVDRCVEVRRDPTPQGYQSLTVLTPEQTITPLEASSPVRAGELLPPVL